MSEGTIQQVLAGEAQWTVVHGDAIAGMTSIPDNSVDACVCDPPYGLGAAPDAVAMLRAWLSDEHYTPGSGGFMGSSWDAFVPGPRYWREVFRVLKPGSYLLAFAGTRTEDLMGLAIRLAGFERRDTFCWVYSQGMSKNANLERMIAVHQCALPGRHFASTLPAGKAAREGDHLCPSTPDSLKWKGQGSALAPSHEPIIVARKPLAGTYAESTLEWGTSMNIEACRIAHAGAADREQHEAGVAAIKARGGSMDESWKNSSDLSGANDVSTAGRWPKNTLLSHVGGPDGCRRIGTTTVKAAPTWDTPNRQTEPSAFTGTVVSKVRHGRSGEASAERRYVGDGSTDLAMTPGPRHDVEDVEQWECVDGCAVRLLAEMSGKSASPPVGSTRKLTRPQSAHTVSMPPKELPNGYGDSGTATRYFAQFQPSELDDVTPFLYRAKPRRGEKDAGCRHFRARSGAEATHSEDGQERLNSARTGAGRTGGVRNNHPTSKSVDLGRWLVRLVARPGQLVITPFCGGGTEGVAAILEGVRWIGIEQSDTDEEPFVSIARARLTHIDGHEFIPRESLRAPEKDRPRQVSLFAAVAPPATECAESENS